MIKKINLKTLVNLLNFLMILQLVLPHQKNKIWYMVIYNLSIFIIMDEIMLFQIDQLIIRILFKLNKIIYYMVKHYIKHLNCFKLCAQENLMKNLILIKKKFLILECQLFQCYQTMKKIYKNVMILKINNLILIILNNQFLRQKESIFLMIKIKLQVIFYFMEF